MELPEHFPIAVDINGDGPVSEQDADRIECWGCYGELWPCKGATEEPGVE